MLVPEVERMRALLVDAITTLCRSGLKYNEKLKVEGLIGITLDEAEIILVNLNRSFELAVSEKKPPSPSSSERESSPECEVIAESRTKSKRSKTASHNTYRESPSGKRSPENNLSGLQTPDDTPRKRLRRPRDRDNVRADDSPAKSLSRATGDQTLVSPNHNAGDKKSVNVCEISDSDNRVAPITSDAVNTPVVYQNRSSEVTDIVIHDVIEKEPETKTETSVSGQEPTGIHISTGYSYSDGQHALTTSEDTNRTSIVASSSRIDDPGHVTESMNPSTSDRQSTSTQGESSGLNRGSTSEQAIIKIEIDSDCEADIKTLAEPNNTNHQESYQGELLSSALPAELAAMTHTNPPDMAGMYNPGQVAYGSPSVSAGVPSLNTPAQLYMTPDMSQGDPGVAPYQQDGTPRKRPRVEGLPDPRDCATEESARIFQAANEEISRQKERTPKSKVRGMYKSYSEHERLTIAKSTLEIGVTKTARKFGLSESSARSMRDRYLKMKQSGEEPKSMPALPRGPSCKLADFDQKVQLYIRTARENGAVINTRMVIAAAEGIMTKFAPHQLACYGGRVTLTETWARSLLRRMGFTQQKNLTGDKELPKDFDTIWANWLQRISDFISKDSIPDQLIINWDQLGCRLLPGDDWTIQQMGYDQVTGLDLDDKRQISVVLSITKSGKLLPPQLIYPGKTPKCLPQKTFPEGWDAFYSPNNSCNEETILRFLDTIIIPYITRQREEHEIVDKPALVIFDVNASYCTDDVIQRFEDNNIRYCGIPATCTDQLQPLDLTVKKEYLNKLKLKYNQWYADQIASQIVSLESEDQIYSAKVDTKMAIIKPIHADWVISVHQEMTEEKELILDGFLKAGIIQP